MFLDLVGVVTVVDVPVDDAVVTFLDGALSASGRSVRLRSYIGEVASHRASSNEPQSLSTFTASIRISGFALLDDDMRMLAGLEPDVVQRIAELAL